MKKEKVLRVVPSFTGSVKGAGHGLSGEGQPKEHGCKQETSPLLWLQPYCQGFRGLT